MNQVFLHLVDLPMTVRGVTVPEDDTGDYIVLINAALDLIARERVIEHELRHIRACHFDDRLTVIEAEQDAG